MPYVVGFLAVAIMILFLYSAIKLDTPERRTVWVTKTGKVYHRHQKCNGVTCQLMMTEKEAVDLGYTKCSRCR